ncbi:hypothetical protein COCON_G00010100 [Conger conger]|uniref:Myelin basic protein n=1 Tax=Conger conger TaxID=82655 RepID=A0A9Q1E298_CONCO|nr:hypothetical protein COCON_G00010100 [Conger conger]
MATASTSGQATFGLGRRKKNPGLLDQIGKFFGGDKKRKSKVRDEEFHSGGKFRISKKKEKKKRKYLRVLHSFVLSFFCYPTFDENCSKLLIAGIFTWFCFLYFICFFLSSEIFKPCHLPNLNYAFVKCMAFMCDCGYTGLKR